MKKLIIAEKPSVRDNIAAALHASEKLSSDGGKNYCLCNDEYYVANTVGHLYDIGYPANYGFSKSYKIDELPMFPAKFDNFAAENDKKDDLRDFLNKMINKSDVDEIICATDAAREGELIFREIYNASSSTKPCKRLWISSVTEKAILDGMANLKPISEYDNYYKAAKTRQELDWLFGMNLSRLYSSLDNDARHIGRVMTPTLAIIAEQDKKVENFVPETTYRITLDGALSEQTFETLELAQDIARASAGKSVNVTDVKCENKTQNRPLLFSLTSLTQEANKHYGFSAQRVLELAQTLYDKKMTTYPRSDGEYLTEDMEQTVLDTVKMLSENENYSEYAKHLLENGLNIDSRVINGSKINDHHAIIPTLQDKAITSALADDEKKIYDLIVNRFLMAVDKKHSYTEINYCYWCEDIDYKIKYKKVIEGGWKSHRLFADNEEEDEISTNIPEYKSGDTFEAKEVKPKECTTRKPSYFTDGTLISCMNNIDNRIEDKELQSAVRGKGIGTTATRAGIIEKIIEKGYAKRDGKYIISTDFGRTFVNSLPEQITSVERTAQWEQEFEDAEKSTDAADTTKLYDDTKDMVSRVISFEKRNTARKVVVNPNAVNKFETVVVGKCWRCGSDIIEKKGFFGCSSYKNKEDKGCGFAFNKAHNAGWYKGEITAEQAKKLLNHEKIKLKSVSSEGKAYEAFWSLSDNGEYVNVIKQAADPAEKTSLGKCWRCDGDIVETQKSYCCTSYKGANDKGCGFVIWKEDKFTGLKISPKNASDLIARKTISVKKKTVSGEITKKYRLVDKKVGDKQYINIEEVKE